MWKIEAFLAAIRVQKGGALAWRRIGRDFPAIVRKSRTNRWELTVSSRMALIAAKNRLFPYPFQV